MFGCQSKESAEDLARVDESHGDYEVTLIYKQTDIVKNKCKVLDVSS